MRHVFKPGAHAGAPTLLLLHGTGGTEHDLLPLADAIDPSAAVLSVRGNVLERGMPRFFRRLAEGVFDEEDLVFRTAELHSFINDAAAEYGFDRGNVVAVGYSNGANIAASMLFHIPGALRAAALHHPMVPRRGVQLPDLQGVSVFVEHGAQRSHLRTGGVGGIAGAAGRRRGPVTMHWENNGHQLTPTEVHTAAQWYRKNVTAATA